MSVLEKTKFSAEELTEQFPNSPLSQVAYEIRFAPRLRIGPEIWRVQEQLGAEYPNIGMQNLVGLGGTLMTTHVFSTSDGSRQISISQQNFGMTFFAYPGFGQFLQDVLGKTTMFCGMYGIDGLLRVGLRYTNNIILPGGTRLLLSDFVNPLVDLNRFDLGNTNQFACEIRSSWPDHGMTLRTTLLSEPVLAYVLDIDTYLERPAKLPEVGRLLSKFHDSSKVAFLDHIKPRLKAHFRGRDPK